MRCTAGLTRREALLRAGQHVASRGQRRRIALAVDSTPLLHIHLSTALPATRPAGWRLRATPGSTTTTPTRTLRWRWALPCPRCFEVCCTSWHAAARPGADGVLACLRRFAVTAAGMLLHQCPALLTVLPLMYACPQALGDRKGINRFGDFTGEQDGCWIALLRASAVAMPSSPLQRFLPPIALGRPHPATVVQPPLGTASIHAVLPLLCCASNHAFCPRLPPPLQPRWTKRSFMWCWTCRGGHT